MFCIYNSAVALRNYGGSNALFRPQPKDGEFIISTYFTLKKMTQSQINWLLDRFIYSITIGWSLQLFVTGHFLFYMGIKEFSVVRVARVG